MNIKILGRVIGEPGDWDVECGTLFYYGTKLNELGKKWLKTNLSCIDLELDIIEGTAAFKDANDEKDDKELETITPDWSVLI